jgi:hypothetical protein
VADYDILAPIQTTAAADTTGRNPGNWTNAFQSSVMPLVNPVYEIYHMVVTGGPTLAAGRIYAPGLTFPYSTVQLDANGNNEWDASQPLILKSGGEVYFLWASPVSGGSPPVVTLWPRYDRSTAVAGG